MATEKTLLCLQEVNPVADNYFSFEHIYNYAYKEVNMGFQKGYTPWNKGKAVKDDDRILAGIHHPMFEKSHTEESRLKITKSLKGNKNHLGHKFSEDTLKNMSATRKGRRPTEATRIKLRGRTPWNKGKKGLQKGCWKDKTFSKEHIEKLSIAHIGKEPWNKGVKGSIRGWSKGLTKETDERVRKVADMKEGVPRSAETLKKVSRSLTGKYRGEKSPHWRGGISYLPYCSKFNKELKEIIRERDNRTCQLCSAKENGEKLHVHHIHHDKENCHPDLICLCRSCHCKTIHKQNYYEPLLMNKLNDRGLLLWTQN